MSLLGSGIANIVEKNKLELVKTLLLNFDDLYDLEELKKFTDLELEDLEKLISKLINDREIFGMLENNFFIPDPTVDQGTITGTKGYNNYCPKCGEEILDEGLSCRGCN
jgi:hypothetical protein